MLVSVELAGSNGAIASEDSLGELDALAESAGARIAGTVSQKLKRLDPRTFIGRGKVQEVRNLARDRDATLAIIGAR